MAHETVFTYAAPRLLFGAGAGDEVGFELRQLGAHRVLLLTDAGVAAAGAPLQVAHSMTAAGIDVQVFDGVHIEPTDDSVRAAVDVARAGGPWDAFVAVGGGSSIDTAKAVNLLTSCGGDLMDYVNAPIGAGRSPQDPLRPLVAVPTTTGTGAESTTVCVLDLVSLHVKAGISHPALRPTLAVVDPELTHSQPAQVTAASGMDILCHALESYTARPFDSYQRKTPQDRAPYCGANPVSDMWAERAMSLLSSGFRRSVRDGSDVAARHDMALAATFAGMGFGNAGVHIPHACAYPLAGRVRAFRPSQYPGQGPLLPHGMAVALTAPQAFRFTFASNPQRHLRAASLLDPDAQPGSDASAHLPQVLVRLMRDVGIPNGIGAVGFDESDVPDLVEGALSQQRLLAISPRTPAAEDLAAIFTGSVQNW